MTYSPHQLAYFAHKLVDALETQLRREVDIHTVLASQWRLR